MLFLGLHFFHGLSQRLLQLGGGIGWGFLADVVLLLHSLPILNRDEDAGDFAFVIGEIFNVHGGAV